MRKKGAVTQRELVPLLKELVDAASAGNSSAHKDVAKRKLRETLNTTNWRTAFVCNNVSSKRLRFIAGMGYPVPSKWMFLDWKMRPGEDKGEIEG